MRGILDIFFKVVSIVGHPILLPTYFALLVNDIYQAYPFVVLGETFGFPVMVIMIVFAFHIRKRKRIATNEDEEVPMLTQQEISEIQGGISSQYEVFFDSTRNRTLSLLIVMLFSVVGYFYLPKLPVLSLIMLLTAISALSCMLINNFWHISIHAFGWGFALYLLLFVYPYLFSNSFLISVLAIIACGLVISSRLYLGRHNNLQVHLGFLIGATIPALLYWLV